MAFDQIRSVRDRLFTVVWHDNLILAAIAIGVGASVGRAGPAVLLGATLSSWCNQRLGFGRAATRILLGCGGGGGLLQCAHRRCLVCP